VIPGQRQSRIALALQAPGVAPAFFLAGLVFVFQPAQVYDANAAFFFVGLRQQGAVLLGAFLVVAGLLSFIASLGGSLARRITAGVLAGVAVAAWVQASFFTGAVGTLDGRSLLELRASRQSIVNAAVFAAIAIGVGAGTYFRPALARRLFLALLAVFFTHAAWVVARDRNPWRAPLPSGEFATLSRDTNLLVVLLDSFQSDFLDELIAREPALGAMFDGFTHFRNAAGHSPTTYVALPTIHSGRPLQPGDSLAALYQQGVVENSFLAKLAAAGHDALLVNPVLGKCPKGARCAAVEQVGFSGARQVLDAAGTLVNLSLFRLAPDALKPAVYRRGRWLVPGGIDKVRASNRVLESMAGSVEGGSARPTTRFLHLFNTHAPVSVDEQCNPVDRPWTLEPALAQDRCALRKLEALFDALRARQLYDRTAILVIADHGAGMVLKPGVGFTMGALASPLLLVKPRESRGPLRTSEALVGLGDIAATACALVAACAMDHGRAVTAQGPAPAKHVFATYTWKNEYWTAPRMPIDAWYELRGPPSRVASWWRLPGDKPAAGASSLEFGESDPAAAYGFGWAGFESHRGRTVRWALGRESDLYLELGQGSDATLVFDTATHGGNAAQQTEVEVNGVRVARIATGGDWSPQAVIVPSAVLAPGPERILFRSERFNAPSTGDARPLALLFDRIGVQR
jgi:hypothetical protein